MISSQKLWPLDHEAGREWKQLNKKSHKSKIRIVLKKWERKVTHGQYIGSTDTQLINEEIAFLSLSGGDPKAENEMTAERDQTLQIKYHAIIMLKTEQQMRCVNSVTRTYKTIYHHDQYWQKNITQTCSTTLWKQMWNQARYNGYQNIPKSVKTRHDSEVTTLG
jgi:hypothetical protein